MTDRYTPEFSHFEDMAPELRAMVWEIVVKNYPPSFVQICPRDDDMRRNMMWDPPGVYTIRIPRPEPAALQIVEGRTIALKRYQPAFSAVDGQVVYFDYARDSFHLRATSRNWAVSCPALGPQLGRVRNLVIYSPGRFPTWHIDQLAPFLRLERLGIQLLPNATRNLQVMAKILIQAYWRNTMNASQLANGYPVTSSPEIEFVTEADIDAFERELNALPAPPS